MKRTMRKMSHEGDTKLAEYEVGVTSEKELKRIEEEFMDDGTTIQVTGASGDIYVIDAYNQTAIWRNGKRIAYACIQPWIPLPSADRLIAEYLLIKNAEPVYWKTANIFGSVPSSLKREIFTAALVGLNSGLLVNLAFQLIKLLKT